AGFDIAHQHRTAAGLLLDIAGKALGQLQVLVQVGGQSTQLRVTAAQALHAVIGACVGLTHRVQAFGAALAHHGQAVLAQVAQGVVEGGKVATDVAGVVLALGIGLDAAYVLLGGLQLAKLLHVALHVFQHVLQLLPGHCVVQALEVLLDQRHQGAVRGVQLRRKVFIAVVFIRQARGANVIGVVEHVIDRHQPIGTGGQGVEAANADHGEERHQQHDTRETEGQLHFHRYVFHLECSWVDGQWLT
uniref:Chaperone protein DnaK n=1 Tax=Steinernema glaseri TaxID=37863 RepID=A0A1I8AET4_9BILA